MSSQPSTGTIVFTALSLLLLLYDISTQNFKMKERPPNCPWHDHSNFDHPHHRPPPPPPSFRTDAGTFVTRTPAGKNTVLDSPDFSKAPLATIWNWTGAVCGSGATIQNEFVDACNDKDKTEQWPCSRFGVVNNSEGRPSCGRYSEGNISTTVNMTSLRLEEVRQAVLSDISKLSKMEPKCNNPATFGTPIDKFSIYFDNDNQSLHSRDCSRHYYVKDQGSAAAAATMHFHSALIGKQTSRRGVVFSGDSMMRQQFEALVCLMRGKEGCIEHYYHHDALYVQYKGRDAHFILTNDDVKKSQPVFSILKEWFPGYFSELEHSGGFPKIGLNDEEPLTAILFLWDNRPWEFRREHFRMNNINLHIASYMYWWDGDNNGNEKIDEYFRAIDVHLMNNPQQTYVFLTQPWLIEGEKPGITEMVRVKRNEYTSNWISNTKSNGLPGPRRRWIVDFGAIADANRNKNYLRKVTDKVHYSCAWLQHYPEQIKSMKINNNEDCKDPMTFAVIQWLLALLVRIQK